MNTTSKLAAISVDLDEVECYAAIHGVRVPEGPATHAVYDRCVPRIEALLEGESIRATFFAIGANLRRGANRETLRRLRDGGHEIANHSFWHRYDLSRQSIANIQDDVTRGADAIESACGRRPVGFRAPGYTLSDMLIDALEPLGVAYDSSVFPSPSYYATKLAVLSWMAIRRKKSQSIVTGPEFLRARKQPYRMSRPYWREGGGMLELPIGVTPWGLPYIGTSLVVGGRRGAEMLTHQMLRQPVIHLELHGFDVADRDADHLQSLAGHRPDLRRPASEKLDIIASAVRQVRDAGYAFVPLEELANRFTARSTQSTRDP